MSKTIEAFAAYHRQKELLTDYLQVASAGLALLRRAINVPNAPALLGALVDACGVKHWGKGKHYKSAAEKVEAGQEALANQGVVQQVAAFDYFSRSIVQDVARFSAEARKNYTVLEHDHRLLKLSPGGRWVSDHCCNDIAGRLNTLSVRLAELQTWIGWRPSRKLLPTLPLFDLIRSIRNRIAHDDAIVGSDLQELSESQTIANALAAFRANYAKRDLPPLPQFVRGKRLTLEVVHAILFGAFLYEIAKEVNAHAASLLDEGEFIDMAFYYSCLIDEHPFRTIRHRSAENRVCYFLAERYLRDGSPLGPQAIIKRLAAQDLRDPKSPSTDSSLWRTALARHEELLGK